MQETCDMHLHTNNSDGVLSGTELLELAKQKDKTNKDIWPPFLFLIS